MCGICGIRHCNGQPVDEAALLKMNHQLAHRGPDGVGLFVQGDIGLAMRRLSVIDVAGSDQPLYNEDQSITLIFNGELYNYQENREMLCQKGHRFRTDGDGETIVHLYEEYGTEAIQHLRGQFAFALWDSKQERLVLARDYMGQKPLYYYRDQDLLIFASEIKAILAHSDVTVEPIFSEPEVLALYLGYGYIPSPMTPFKNIFAVEPGHYLVCENNQLHTQKYWSLPETSGVDTNARADDWLEELHHLLDEATRLRMIADVPLGAFLSGGLDSSLIAALMQKHASAPVKTFSIGFEGDDSFDETSYAEKVATLLGTEHTAFRVRPDAISLLPKLVWHYDQPFADSSAIPTFLVSELTRQHVTVALTGDGGDELFAGYERFYAASLVEKLGAVPRPIWKIAAQTIDRIPQGTDYYNPVKRAARFAKGASQSLGMAYFDWVRLFHAEWVHDLCGSSDHAGKDFLQHLRQPTQLSDLVTTNMQTYLPDDLLIKADRCSMAASLESRAPFLDHKLVEFGTQIPLNLKLNGNTTKYILKKLAESYLPDNIVHRKKHGFGVPLGAWFRQDITPVQEILLDTVTQQRRLFNQQAVAKLLQEHTSGKRDHGQRIWTLLALEWWYRIFIDERESVRP